MEGTAYSSILSDGTVGGVYTLKDSTGKVVGSVVSSRIDLVSQSPDPASAAWHIRTAQEPSGSLSQVQYFWRHNTTGGVAPSGSCVEGKSPEVDVPFTALYGFYACDAPGPAPSPAPPSGAPASSSWLAATVACILLAILL